MIDKKEMDACVKHINNNSGWYEDVREATRTAISDYLLFKYGTVDSKKVDVDSVGVAESSVVPQQRIVGIHQQESLTVVANDAVSHRDVRRVL